MTDLLPWGLRPEQLEDAADLAARVAHSRLLPFAERYQDDGGHYARAGRPGADWTLREAIRQRVKMRRYRRRTAA